MATPKKFSKSDLSKARKAGFKRKKPKRPKQSASLTVWENYVARWNNWVDDAKAKIKEKADKEREKEKKKKLITQVRKQC